MHIQYSDHLVQRLNLRKISYDLPREIYEKSNERYYDIETGHTVAIMQIVIYGMLREVMVAYNIDEKVVRLLTIHPLKEGQKENRLKSGRWRSVK